MGKKLLVLAFAIVLLAGGAALIAFPTLRPAGSETTGRGEGLRGAGDGAAAGPVLAGRPSTDAPGAGRVPEAVAEADPASSEEASVAVDAVELGDAMRALIADIRRDVAPEWWGVYPTLGTLEGLHGILIARAPADVLDALARYLDARRQGDASGQEEPPPPDESSLEAMRAALRPLLRGILRREHEIGASLQAWEQGRLADAQSMAEAVLVEEPDNLLATTIRKATVASVEGTSPGASTARELERTRARYRELERQHTLQDWVMRWPSRGTWKALAAVRKRAKPAFWSALAPDLDEMLDRGGVTIELSDASLYEAVRRIQIETFADVRLARDVEEPQGRLQFVGVQAEARSLRWILDELVGSLPEGWTWVLGREQVVLTRAGHATASQPETRLRYFDVKDLLVPGTPPSELQVVGGPRTPPVYRPDPAGGPPLRVEDEQAGGRPSR
jgi:hypothetical protein